MDIQALRIMTFLSKLGGKKYANQTVQKIAELDIHYLRYLYFTQSNLSFNDEVLTAIGITTEWRITKPGKDVEKYRAFSKYLKDNMHYFDLIQLHVDVASARKKRMKIGMKIHAADDRAVFRRGNLQRNNNIKPAMSPHIYNPIKLGQ